MRLRSERGKRDHRHYEIIVKLREKEKTKGHIKGAYYAPFFRLNSYTACFLTVTCFFVIYIAKKYIAKNK